MRAAGSRTTSASRSTSLPLVEEGWGGGEEPAGLRRYSRAVPSRFFVASMPSVSGSNS